MRDNNQWLTNHLITQGFITEGRIGRKIQNRRCKKCKAHIITALDADMIALLAECDPTPLTLQGEITALVQGRWTYRLQYEHLNRRYQLEIAATPANTTTVLQQHQCPNPATT